MTERRRDKQVPGVIRFITRMLQIILYIPIQIVFIPFTIVGLIIGAYKEMVRSRRMGVSYSAGQTLQYRWFMHYFDTRPDPYSAAFTRKFPCESHFGLWSLMGALILSQRLFGFTTKLGKIPQPGEETLGSTAAIRVLTFDRILEHYVDEMETNVPPASNPPSRTSACEMVQNATGILLAVPARRSCRVHIAIGRRTTDVRR